MAKTDVEQLAAFINLPYKPLAARWETIEREGGRDWSLAALLTLAPADARALVASSPRLGGNVRGAREHLLGWFPPAIRDAYKDALASDAEAVPVRATRLEATAFFAPAKSPLVHGDALVFEPEGLVYLSLYTM